MARPCLRAAVGGDVIDLDLFADGQGQFHVTRQQLGIDTQVLDGRDDLRPSGRRMSAMAKVAAACPLTAIRKGLCPLLACSSMKPSCR